jgi:transcriptional regulator with PAS, ATPase and Fis domain
VLQEREFEPLGATAPVKADVRVVAATKEDLSVLVQKGNFRDDLYFRLKVIKLELPPLKERREDIPLLIEHFIEKFNRKMGRMIEQVCDEVLAALMHYDFPGNVRELENIIEHAFVMCRGEEIQPQHLPPEFSQSKFNSHRSLHQSSPFLNAERQTLLQALAKHNWNKIETAKELGVHRATLYRKMKKYGLI